jgi:4-deoxy-L-threo-5-hexosulose-uronate ketol-isomerase
MEIRHQSHPEDVKRYTTEQLRKHFLIEDLFQADKITMVYSHYDRTIIGGAVPVKETLKLGTSDALKTDYFLERREMAVANIGGNAIVTVEGQTYNLQKLDTLYIGKGNKEVSFQSESAAEPAHLYMFSCGAHQTYPTTKIEMEKANPVRMGSPETNNERTIYQYIHADGVQSCQLMLGITLLQPGSLWNTMPAHVHDRRMEAYLYFNLDENARVFHFMGEPNETRHMLIKNEQAIISPSWSVHSGCGTGSYSFIWAMAGENYTFKDMDFIEMKDLR